MRYRVSLPCLATLFVASSVLCLTSGVANARPAPSMNDLRGTYTGVYTPNSGGQGQLTLKITQDKLKNGNRSIKATAKFGNKSYKLQGALTEATRQLNLGGTSGRPPQITFVTVTGYFNEGGTDLDGGYTIGTLSSTQIGTISVSR